MNQTSRTDCIPAGDAMSEQVNTPAESTAKMSKKVALLRPFVSTCLRALVLKEQRPSLDTCDIEAGIEASCIAASVTHLQPGVHVHSAILQVIIQYSFRNF